jgi:hypothetical protein
VRVGFASRRNGPEQSQWVDRPGINVGGVHNQRLLEGSIVLVPIETTQRDRQIDVRLGIIRPMRKHLFAVRDRLLVAPKGRKRANEIVVRLGVVGPDCKRVLVLRNSSFHAPEQLQGIA